LASVITYRIQRKIEAATMDSKTRTAPQRPETRTGIVSKEPIHEQILPYIRQDIVTNRWKPGDRLPEPALCREFGVSRTPLRDVLKILEREGLVRLLPHVGAVVTELDPPDLSEKFEVLAALEQIAAMKVARSRPKQAVREIERLHQAMVEASAKGQRNRYYELNDQFHRAIVTGAENATLSAMHETIMWHVYRARHQVNEDEPLRKTSVQHQAVLVNHILAGREEEAGRAMRQHLEEVGQKVLARMRALALASAKGAKASRRGKAR
jgi:DNA-binding GntR family transcriptional regulator